MNMKVVIISGSPRENANTEIMMKHVVKYVEQKDAELKFINLSEGGFEYYRGWVDDYNEKTLQAAKDIMAADVWLIGTPIYNSMYSAALKNLFEFVNYKEILSSDIAPSISIVAPAYNESLNIIDSIVSENKSFELKWKNDLNSIFKRYAFWLEMLS